MENYVPDLFKRSLTTRKTKVFPESSYLINQDHEKNDYQNTEKSRQNYL